MASLAVSFAIANPHIHATVIDATEFPDLTQRYQVRGVPRTVIDDDEAIEGAIPPAAFTEAVVAAGTPRRAAG
jgi:predicted DsbA family dithiol-disulfide isomerase